MAISPGDIGAVWGMPLRYPGLKVDKEVTIPGFISDSPLARELIGIGDEAIARENDAKLRDCFADDYVFHGPDGELSFSELRAYLESLRAALSNLQIIREQIIVDGNFLAARNTFSGDINSVFTHSPIGPLEPAAAPLR